MDIQKRNPKMTNVYPEIGSFFNVLVLADPILAMHGVGTNIKHYGADHVIWGRIASAGDLRNGRSLLSNASRSPTIVRQVPLQEDFEEDKARIFGLNAAKIYGIDVKAKRNPLPADTLDKLKSAYVEGGGQRTNAVYGWVPADD